MDQKANSSEPDPRSDLADQTKPAKILLRVLSGDRIDPPPVWLMRQAGRYLPEYRELRARAGTFLDFCFNPELAVEATLQPIRRYGFDAAILFSDILVVPHGLGQKVWFEEGHGPKLDALKDPSELDPMRGQDLRSRLSSVYQAVQALRRELPRDVTLIGFAGAPWTVATYMLEGGSSRDFPAAKRWMSDRPGDFSRLIELLVDATVTHLSAQAAAGAEALQIFDSWAGALPEEEVRRWSIAPLAEIVRRLKAEHPEVPVILFPRGVGQLYREFAADIGPAALSIDSTVPLDWAREELQDLVAIQGNLDPEVLLAGGTPLVDQTGRILEDLGAGAFVFNLGHGILPATPTENVDLLLRTIRHRQA